MCFHPILTPHPPRSPLPAGRIPRRNDVLVWPVVYRKKSKGEVGEGLTLLRQSATRLAEVGQPAVAAELGTILCDECVERKLPYNKGTRVCV